MELIKHVLQYVSRIQKLGIKFDGEVDIPTNVIGYTNFNLKQIENKLEFMCLYLQVLQLVTG